MSNLSKQFHAFCAHLHAHQSLQELTVADAFTRKHIRDRRRSVEALGFALFSASSRPRESTSDTRAFTSLKTLRLTGSEMMVQDLHDLVRGSSYTELPLDGPVIDLHRDVQHLLDELQHFQRPFEEIDVEKMAMDAETLDQFFRLVGRPLKKLSVSPASFLV